MRWLPLNTMHAPRAYCNRGPVPVAQVGGVRGVQRGARSERAGATWESSAFG